MQQQKDSPDCLAFSDVQTVPKVAGVNPLKGHQVCEIDDVLVLCATNINAFYRR